MGEVSSRPRCLVPPAYCIGRQTCSPDVSDLLVECSLLIAGWFATRRTGSGIGKKWLALGVVAQLVFLVSMYNGSEFFIGDHEWTWNPRSSLVPRPQVLESTVCRAPVGFH